MSLIIEWIDARGGNNSEEALASALVLQNRRISNALSSLLVDYLRRAKLLPGVQEMGIGYDKMQNCLPNCSAQVLIIQKQPFEILIKRILTILRHQAICEK
jgi:hypothetical protein